MSKPRIKDLIIVLALGLGASVSAYGARPPDANVVELSNASTVMSSVGMDDSGTVTNTIVGRTGSLCSAVLESKRCEITCQAPQLAQCGKGAVPGEPSCACR